MLFDAYGNIIDVVNPSAINVNAGAYKWSFLNVWQCAEIENAATLKAYNYEQFIDNVYEPLRAEYPSYISRNVIGKDASDNYNLYQYTLSPDYPEQTIFLEAGVHGDEIDAWLGLGRFVQAICNEWKDSADLAYLRWKCRIVVVPIVNPYGMERKTRNNLYTNINRDTKSKTQPETRAVLNVVDNLQNTYGISFALDYHTSISRDWSGDCYFGINKAAKNLSITRNVGLAMARSYANERVNAYLTAHALTKDALFLPQSLNGKTTTVNTEGTFAEYFNLDLGIAGATIEFSDYIYDTQLATNTTIKKATEVIGNQIIALANAKFGILY